MSSLFVRPAARSGALALLWMLSLAAACGTSDTVVTSGGSADPPATPPSSRAASTSVSAPFDLGGIMKQVHFAYRAEGDGFAGGHRTYEVRASASGFAFTPAADGASASVPARFVTTSIARGQGQPAPAAGEPRVAPDGHLAVARGAMTEHLRNDRDGVEQSFEIPTRPEGSSDLVVRVRVTGQTYAGLTAGGHHFRDPATGLGTRYGSATWIDGRGERTPLDVVWTGEELAITVPENVIDGSTYPAVLDPTVSPELGIDTPVPQVAQGDQTIPAVGFDGTNYLVAWHDTRVGAGRLMATRVSSAGAVLDSTGIAVAAKAYVEVGTNRPAIGFDGTNYLIAWANSSYGYLRSVRVSTSGAVVDSTPLTLAGTYVSSTPSVAFDGTNYLVVGATSTTVGGIRVSKAGALVGNAITISNATGNQTAPAVAFDGTNYFVVWQDNRGGFNYDIYGTRVSTAGTVVDGAGTGIAISTAANDQLAPTIAFDGTNYLVAWSDGRWGTPDIYGARVSPAGLVLDTSGIGISSMTADAQTVPRVAFDGTNHVVVWADARAGGSDVYAARVSPAGVVADPNGIAISAGTAGEQAPAIACSNAGSCFAAWQDQRAGTWDAFGARISGGAVTDALGIELTRAANDEVTPAVAFDGTNYMVVWQDRRNATNWDVFGARVSATGTVLDPSGIAISTATGDQITPRIAWMPSSYFVVWEDKRSGTGDIYGARVDASGAVLDAAGISISAATNEQRTPSVAGDGTNYFVVWSDARSGVFMGYGARVSAAGAVLDSTGISFTNAGTVTSPAVAYDGTRYLVVWSAGTIRGNRVTTAGAMLDGATGFQINASGTAPSIAFDGLNFLTVFERNSGVFGARVTGAAAVLDTTGLPIAPFVSYIRDQPAVGCDGSACLVAWRADGAGAIYTLYGSFVDQSGTVLNAGGFGISTSAKDHATPAVARDLAGHALVVYQSLDIDPPAGSQRIHARLVTSLGQGQACSAATDCASGFCADGVCCNSACGNSADSDCLACSVAKGATADGNCTALTGTSCNDGNGCTQTDTCQAGTCMGGSPVVCTASDPCHTAGTCNPATGTCSNPAKANGSACDDGNACTQTDTCQSGACVGNNPVTCPVAAACQQVAACDPGTGMCAVTPVADGTSCNDGNKCTAGDSCQGGVCVGGAPIVCTALDGCHDAGACNPTTGVCTNPPKADGAACDDSDLCTQTDTCKSGVCVGANPVVCTIKDQCHTKGTCDPTTGMCDDPTKADGAACSDGNGCTETDTCQAGVCTGGAAVVCTAKDECHEVGTCNTANGVCSNPNKANGTPCSGGACQGGKCIPDTGTSSSSSSSSSSASSASSASSGTPSTSSSSSGGTGGAGGAEPSSSSSGGDGGNDGGGCGCRTAGEGEGSAKGGVAMLLLGLLATRRRARSARRAA
ncbi:Flagellar hook-length control protein FliK [Minicystis rosea]|nr:Flagellar hook-length control protein FliK [Minicystis rosea]